MASSKGSTRMLPKSRDKRRPSSLEEHLNRLLRELKEQKVGIEVTLPPLELVGLNHEKIEAYFKSVFPKITDPKEVNGFNFFVLKWDLSEKQFVLIRMPILIDNVVRLILIFTPADFYHIGFEKQNGDVRLYCIETDGRERNIIAEIRKYYMKKFQDVKFQNVDFKILKISHGYPNLEDAAGLTRHEIKLGLIDLRSMVESFNAESYGVGAVPQEDFVSHVIRGAQLAEVGRGKQMLGFVGTHLEHGKEITPDLISLDYCWSAESHRVQLKPDEYPDFEVIWGPRGQTYSEMHSNYNFFRRVGKETIRAPPCFTFRRRNRNAQYLSTYDVFKKHIEYVKSSKTWELTKDHPDYQIRGVIHICHKYLVLQFECSHIKFNHVLNDIDIVVTQPEGEKKIVRRISSLAHSTPKHTFVYFERGVDIFVGNIKSQISFKEVDQNEKQAVNMSLDLSDMNIGVTNYLISAQSFPPENFLDEWEKLSENEIKDSFEVNTTAVQVFMDDLRSLLEMRFCNQEGLGDECWLYSEFCSEKPSWVFVVAKIESEADGRKVELKLSTRSVISSVCRAIHDLVRHYCQHDTTVNMKGLSLGN